MRLEERLERVEALLKDLREANRNTPVIVEGRRDVRALRALGLEGAILTLNTGKPVFQTCEEVSRAHEAAIILTDWDRRGGQLCRLLRKGLEANGTPHDVDFRARLAHLTKKEASAVEELAGFLKRLRRDPRVRSAASRSDTYK